MATLTKKLLLEYIPDAETSKQVDLKGKGIGMIEDVSMPACFRLDLTGNALSSEECLTGLRKCTSISFLNLSENQLKTLQGVQRLPHLQVLNVSHNAMEKLSCHLLQCSGLKALIVSHNQLQTLDHLTNLKQLGTLVISNNPLKTLPDLSMLTALTKLSVSHCKLNGVPDVSKNTKLKELRLNGNNITSIGKKKLPESIEILDLGNNKIASLDKLTALAHLPKLSNLNLKSNAVTEMDGYKENIKVLVPKVRVLDTERFDDKFVARKKKREAMVIKRAIKTVKQQRQDKNTDEKPDTVTEEKENAVLEPEKTEEETRKRKAEDIIAPTFNLPEPAKPISGVVSVINVKKQAKRAKMQPREDEKKLKRSKFSVNELEKTDDVVAPGWD